MLPTFLIIGAMKSGTTSLYAYLKEHPQIGMPVNKEPDFFSNELVWQRGLSWYENLFDAFQEKTALGEASVNYTKYPYYDNVPSRIASILPGVKLIYILRPPVERIYSHYLHNVYAGIEDESFEQAVANKPLYIQTSLYYTQIEQFLHHFAQERLMVLLLEDLQQQPLATVQRIFAFLGVDASYVPPNIHVIKHQGKLKRGSDNVLMKFLRKTRCYHAAADKLPNPVKDLSSYLLKKKVSKPEPMSVSLYNKLLSELLEDIERLSRFLNRDLTAWISQKTI